MFSPLWLHMIRQHDLVGVMMKKVMNRIIEDVDKLIPAQTAVRC